MILRRSVGKLCLISNKRTHHFPQTSSFLDTPIFNSFSLFFDYTFVSFHKWWESKIHYYYFPKTLIWLSYQAISLSSQKQIPEFSFRFFVKDREISFLKWLFGGKFSIKKQPKSQEKVAQDFRIHLFVHTSVIAKSSSLDNFISFSCW